MTTLEELPAPAVDFQACRILCLDLPSEVPPARVVHELDGVSQPVEPSRLLAVGHALWSSWLGNPHHDRPDVLLGFDNSGIVPTLAVAMASGLPYHLAWKLETEQSAIPRRRSAEIFTYGRLQGRRVLIVDSALTHCAAITSLISVLRDEAADVVGVASLTEDAEGSNRLHIESTGVPLVSLTSVR
ncbi:adenine phosphoribosyltransferase [Crossiella equi]|uniref:Adenine phosphoribosyltransferase n=1 Tax=Crossiella equi TaxID=130796 RepID=A0ABS5ADV4_9PSEU|nr:phosphoribosyltransferase [Crossiella equi]MBP2474770.1 adenine phosphoribosyltransferase [Crossiella equi]